MDSAGRQVFTVDLLERYAAKGRGVITCMAAGNDVILLGTSKGWVIRHDFGLGDSTGSFLLSISFNFLNFFFFFFLNLFPIPHNLTLSFFHIFNSIKNVVLSTQTSHFCGVRLSPNLLETESLICVTNKVIFF